MDAANRKALAANAMAWRWVWGNRKDPMTDVKAVKLLRRLLAKDSPVVCGMGLNFRAMLVRALVHGLAVGIHKTTPPRADSRAMVCRQPAACGLQRLRARRVHAVVARNARCGTMQRLVAGGALPHQPHPATRPQTYSGDTLNAVSSAEFSSGSNVGLNERWRGFRKECGLFVRVLQSGVARWPQRIDLDRTLPATLVLQVRARRLLHMRQACAAAPRGCRTQAPAPSNCAPPPPRAATCWPQLLFPSQSDAFVVEWLLQQ